MARAYARARGGECSCNMQGVVPRRAFRVVDLHVVREGPGHVSEHGHRVCGQAWCRVARSGFEGLGLQV